MIALERPMKWVGSHARAAEEILAEAELALGGRAPTAYADPTVGGGGLAIAALSRWPEARPLLADASPPLGALWRAIASDPAGTEAEVARLAAEIDAESRAAADAARGLPGHARTIGKRRVEATAPQWAAYDARRRLYHALRERWNADEAAGGTAPGHAARFAVLGRTSYNGLVRFSAAGAFNAPPGASPGDRLGRAVYPAGAFEALGAELARRGADVAAEDYRAAIERWARAGLLRGALLYLDPPFPGEGDTDGFHAYFPGCVVPEVAELAEAAALASWAGAAVVVSHPAFKLGEWREALPDAAIRADVTRRGALEPGSDRPPKLELIVRLAPGRGWQ